MSGRPPDGATFEATRLGRGRPRRPIAVFLWAGLLVGLIGFAVLGRDGPAPGVVADGTPTTTPEGNVADLGSLVPAPGDPVFGSGSEARAGPPQLDALVTLDASTGDSEATTGQSVSRRVWVAGRVFVRADLLVVSIESPLGRIVGSRSIFIDTEAVIRPARAPDLNLSFTIPGRVTDSRVWVSIRALDSNGLLVAELRREIPVGAATQAWLERPLNLMN